MATALGPFLVYGPPGELPRAVRFGIGVTLVVVMILLLLVDRFHAAGVFS
jgi:hypothetical protein